MFGLEMKLPKKIGDCSLSLSHDELEQTLPSVFLMVVVN